MVDDQPRIEPAGQAAADLEINPEQENRTPVDSIGSGGIPATPDARLSSPGFGTRMLRAGVNVIMLISIAALAMVAWIRVPILLQRINDHSSALAGSPSGLSTESPAVITPQSAYQGDTSADAAMLSPLSPASSSVQEGVSRKTLLYTIIPTRPRVDVITYTVQTGDSLFSIADKYNLKPETILWGNFETLEDNPHLLSTGQVLNILPTDGTYYQWSQGDNLDNIAAFFQVDSESILSYPGNNIDLTAEISSSLGIEPGTWVIIPNGRRPLKDWGPPAISRSNPASARYYGDGYCGSVYEGAIGTGTFIWPTTAHSISGYGYSGIHPAIDIAGATGNAVFASDNGVVVFAGWSNYGYGYMVVIDHGNGWQTAYAHLSAVAVTCGQSVFQGGYIGAVGSTGNSTGSHLHFEMVYNGAKPNPLDYIQ